MVLREVSIAFLILVVSISSYNLSNNFMDDFKNEADANPGVPNWVIDTVWWSWNHWIYLMIGSAFVILLIATQTRLPQGEWEF